MSWRVIDRIAEQLDYNEEFVMRGKLREYRKKGKVVMKLIREMEKLLKEG
jgi:hypothetical protein